MAVFVGHAAGALGHPTKTVFQTALPHFPSEFLENHCCWEAKATSVAILQSARKPPLAHPALSPPITKSVNCPEVWTRRISVPWDTGQLSSFRLNEKFSSARQNEQVALPGGVGRKELAWMFPSIVTWSGVCPKPRIWV